MTRILALAALAALLSGCGVDGPPSRPTADEAELQPGFNISGSVGVGVTGGRQRLDLSGS